jgi:hypothetical protein
MKTARTVSRLFTRAGEASRADPEGGGYRHRGPHPKRTGGRWAG